MNPDCTIQLFTAGAWRDVGSVSLFAPPQQGWRAHSYTGYDVAWAVEHEGARDAHAFTCRFPVGLAPLELPHWPVFLIDLLPQGFGREEMLRRMNLPDLTVHGFRSSFRDWVSEETSFPREVAEMALAHAVGSAVERAYRRGDSFDKRRELMNAWADFCASAA